MSIYLNGEFYELKFCAFNSIFGSPSSMDLRYRYVPEGLNPSAFWNEISGIISVIQATPKVLLLEALVFKWPNDYLPVVCL